MNYLALTRDGGGLLGASYGGGYGISAADLGRRRRTACPRGSRFRTCTRRPPSADGHFAYFVSLASTCWPSTPSTVDLLWGGAHPARAGDSSSAGRQRSAAPRPQQRAGRRLRPDRVLRRGAALRAPTPTPARSPSTAPASAAGPAKGLGHSVFAPTRRRTTTSGAPTCTSATAVAGCGRRSARRARWVRCVAADGSRIPAERVAGTESQPRVRVSHGRRVPGRRGREVHDRLALRRGRRPTRPAPAGRDRHAARTGSASSSDLAVSPRLRKSTSPTPAELY